MGQKEVLKVKALSSRRHKLHCRTTAYGHSVPTQVRTFASHVCSWNWTVRPTYTTLGSAVQLMLG